MNVWEENSEAYQSSATVFIPQMSVDLDNDRQCTKDREQERERVISYHHLFILCTIKEGR